MYTIGPVKYGPPRNIFQPIYTYSSYQWQYIVRVLLLVLAPTLVSGAIVGITTVTGIPS